MTPRLAIQRTDIHQNHIFTEHSILEFKIYTEGALARHLYFYLTRCIHRHRTFCTMTTSVHPTKPAINMAATHVLVSSVIHILPTIAGADGVPVTLNLSSMPHQLSYSTKPVVWHVANVSGIFRIIGSPYLHLIGNITHVFRQMTGYQFPPEIGILKLLVH